MFCLQASSKAFEFFSLSVRARELFESMFSEQFIHITGHSRSHSRLDQHIPLSFHRIMNLSGPRDVIH